MKRTMLFLCLSAVILLAACGPASEPAATIEKTEPGIEGVWTFVETETIGGPNEGKNTNPQPSFVFITENYYSTMFVSGTEPRAFFDTQTPTEKQKAEAYDGFIAAAGPYEIDGSTMTIQSALNLQPDMMADGCSWTLEYQLDGDTLTLIMDPKKVVYTTMEYTPDYTEGRYVLRRLE